jgi:hypothetical protein
MMKGRKAAIELSIGTIVIIVIAMSMLILGIILVRQVMCAGIVLTEDISRSTENEIKGLFGSQELGLRCMGEQGQEVELGGGGRRQIICIANEEENVQYDVKLRSNGANYLDGPGETRDASGLVLDKGWTGSVSPGSAKTITVAVLDVPRDIPNSNIKLEFDVERTLVDSGTSSEDTHTLYIDLVPVSSFTAAIC